jgi:nucleotide-binding universal stress UspA family protein
MTPTHTESTRRIVVGVDGSDCSKAALRWAMTQARLTDSTVEAVLAWHAPGTSGAGYGWATAAAANDNNAAYAAKVLNDTIAEVAGQVPQPVNVLAQALPGHPAEVLLHAAKGATLLVVGSRGRNGFTGMLLGSVSQHCVQHAPCSVVVAH